MQYISYIYEKFAVLHSIILIYGLHVSRHAPYASSQNVTTSKHTERGQGDIWLPMGYSE